MLKSRHGGSRPPSRARRRTTPSGAALVALAGIFIGSAGTASAQDEGGMFANACTSCHGVDGHSIGAIPSIAGLDPAAFLAIMEAFRSGTAEATIMHRFLAVYSDEELAVIAQYFAER